MAKGLPAYPAKSEEGFKLVVHQRFGELTSEGIWRKELRIVEWGKYQPKFDIRMWDSAFVDGTRSGRGVTLELDEVKKLKEILDNLDLESIVMPEKKIEPELRIR